MNWASRAGTPAREERIGVLVVDPDTEQREMMSRFLAAWNFAPQVAASAGEALALASSQEFGIAVISDPVMETGGIELVRALRAANPELETILLAADDSAGFATEAFRAGVSDCLKWPVDFKQLGQDLNLLREAVGRRLERKAWEVAAGSETVCGEIVGVSAPMQAVFAAIRRYAAEDSPVLITGLIGTGKELAARTLHALSRRSSQPLVVYRCCGVSEALAEVELFGQVPRAGPRRKELLAGDGKENGAGLLETACGGTILFDELWELPATIQTKLEHVLAESQIERGGEAGSALPVRVLAASRLNLAEQSGRGQFSSALYRWLHRSVIHLPSLAERTEDIPLLCRYFQDKFNQEYGKAIRGFSAAAEYALRGYRWPGNVRELENVVGRACLVAAEEWIELADLSLDSPPEGEAGRSGLGTAMSNPEFLRRAISVGLTGKGGRVRPGWDSERG